MTRRRFGLALAAALFATPATSAPLDLVYERTLMTAADARCGLFEPGVRSALSAFQAQAKGAALRAGTTAREIAAVEGRARAAAGAAACDSKDLNVAAARVRSAFDGYARLIRMDFPGDLAAWKADRSSSRDALRWRLWQPSAFGRDRMIFGLAGREGANAFVAVAWFADNSKPYGARLVMRDVRLVAQPYIGGASLAQRLPPTSLRGVMAEARSPAGEDLRPAGVKGGWAFRFPAHMAAEMARLDPREAVAIDFLLPGDKVRRAHIEVGDFAAGRAFLAAY